METKYGNLLAILLILFAGRCEGQKFSFGACPTVTPQTIALLNPGLIGQWFEWSRTPNIAEHGWKCVTYTFAQVVTNQQLSVSVRGVQKLTGATMTATGTVTVTGTVDANNILTGMLSVIFNNNKIVGRASPVVYTVVGRDAAAAVNFITLYGCKSFGVGRLEYVIILTSSRTPTIATLDSAFAAATSVGVPSSLIKKTDQTGC